MLIDLTHSYFEGMPQGGAMDRAYLRRPKAIPSAHAPGAHIDVSYLDLMTHVGTHIDAPCHFISGGASIAELPLSRLAGPATMIRLDLDEARAIGCAELSGGDQPIRHGDIVFVRTGWGRYFTATDATRYLDHPWFLPEVAEFLLERDVAVFGCDTISPDPPLVSRDPAYPMTMHVSLLSAGVPIIENLNLELLPTGYVGAAYAFPLKLPGADGSPVRVVADVTGEL